MLERAPTLSNIKRGKWPFHPSRAYQSPEIFLEIDVFDLTETESNKDSRAALVNMSLLATIAAWAMPRETVAALFEDAPPEELRKLHTQMNRDVVRVVMLVLAHRAFATGEVQSFSLRQLAKAIDAPRVESMQRTLRNWLLPMLSRAGLIEGFVLTTTWSTEPHEIAITPKGLACLKAYFSQLAETAPLFQPEQECRTNP